MSDDASEVWDLCCELAQKGSTRRDQAASHLYALGYDIALPLPLAPCHHDDPVHFHSALLMACGEAGAAEQEAIAWSRACAERTLGFAAECGVDTPLVWAARALLEGTCTLEEAEAVWDARVVRDEADAPERPPDPYLVEEDVLFVAMMAADQPLTFHAAYAGCATAHHAGLDGDAERSCQRHLLSQALFRLLRKREG